MKKLFFISIALVLAEIAIFIMVGKVLGVVSTLLLIVLISFIGLVIAKKLGFNAVYQIRNNIANGNPPGESMIDTFLIFVGALLLLLPGFLSDLFGLTFLFAFTRNRYKPFIYRWLQKKFERGNFIIIQR